MASKMGFPGSISAIVLLAGLCLPSLAAPGCNEAGLVRYLAGIEVLKNMGPMPAGEAQAYYRRLVKLTGIDAQCATAALKNYFNAPERWKKINDAVIKTLEENDALQKKEKE
jgi:hypothetical protein